MISHTRMGEREKYGGREGGRESVYKKEGGISLIFRYFLHSKHNDVQNLALSFFVYILYIHISCNIIII